MTASTSVVSFSFWSWTALLRINLDIVGRAASLGRPCGDPGSQPYWTKSFKMDLVGLSGSCYVIYTRLLNNVGVLDCLSD